MTPQLNYLIAQQRQAELVSRGEQARRANQARLTDYPPLCAHGMNSLTDSGYELALGRLGRSKVAAARARADCI